ncbi:MAG: glucosaminidase domain-containing protein [Pseudomonadota bacterium]
MTSVTDFTQYAALRADAQANDDGALRSVAEQFEALFVQQMLKSMRDASFGDPFFPDTGGHQVYRDLLDQQLAADTADRGGIGLADMIVSQMQPRAPIQVTKAVVHESPAGWSDPKSFVADVLPHAKKAAERLGVSPLAVLSQAALETGWGQKVPVSERQQSNNLFGIKAGGSWGGDKVDQATLEFRDGTAQRERAAFRAYPSLEASFSDYASFLSKSRYQSVSNTGNDVGGFADALQAAGYATDPNYAHKIRRIAGSETMRDALAALKQDDLLSLSTQQATSESGRRP